MKEKTREELYTSPQAKIVEVKVRKMLCGSPEQTFRLSDDGQLEDGGEL